MKQYIVDRHTTPSTPTLDEVPNEKIRVFKNEATIDAALPNLDEDEIVATEDGAESSTRVGNPLGTILAIHSNAVPYGYLPCNGVAFDEHQYPALYALLGDNHTPYSYDKSRLGDYEEITISTDANNPTVIEYDGYVKIIAGTSSGVTGVGITIEMYVNGNLASKYNVSSGSPTNFLATVNAEVKKGDKVYYKLTNMVITKTLARFYTHFNVIKATSGLEETQQDYVLQSLLEADNYSTSEVATGTKWIDGKTIYRKVLTGTSIPSGNYIGEISNFDTVIKADGWIKDASLGNWLPVGYGVVNNNTSNPQMRVDSNSKVYFAVANYSVLKYVVTIEYTKNE